ncbi:MAG: antitoxin Xre-like helix-turn-helix domain-containing protein [Bosea sp. (in: a-proteobacteria)]
MLQQIPRTAPSPQHPAISEAEASAMARAVIRLFGHWQISDAVARELLGGLSARSYARWKAGEPGRIDRDLATRLSLLMGIHKGLRILFTEPARGYAWISAPNDAFGQRAPIEIMAQGDIFSLARIRSYLDAERGGW